MVCISILKNKIKTNTHYVSILPLTFYHGGWKWVQYIYPSVCYCFYLIHPRNPITVTWSHPFFHSGAQLHPTGRSSPISPGPSWQLGQFQFATSECCSEQPRHNPYFDSLSSGYFLRSELTGTKGKQIPLWRVVSLPKQHMWCLAPTKRTEQSPPFETKGQKCLREAPVSIILSTGKDWVSFLTCLRVICICFSLFVFLQVIPVLVLNHQAQGQSLSTQAVSTAAEWTRHLTGKIQGQTAVPSAQASRRTLSAHTDNTHSVGPVCGLRACRRLARTQPLSCPALSPCPLSPGQQEWGDPSWPQAMVQWKVEQSINQSARLTYTHDQKYTSWRIYTFFKNNCSRVLLPVWHRPSPATAIHSPYFPIKPFTQQVQRGRTRGTPEGASRNSLPDPQPDCFLMLWLCLPCWPGNRKGGVFFHSTSRPLFRLCACTAAWAGSIPGQWTKTLHAELWSKFKTR